MGRRDDAHSAKRSVLRFGFGALKKMILRLRASGAVPG
jgi:hypothetical protein